MRVGRPCVTGLDAGREVINPPEAGRAIDPADHDALVEAIVSLLTPGEAWERTSESARRRYNEQFTAAHFQERLAVAVQRMAE
jgi:glycosyltransferase involved in cell wall biosynthesis